MGACKTSLCLQAANPFAQALHGGLLPLQELVLMVQLHPRLDGAVAQVLDRYWSRDQQGGCEHFMWALNLSGSIKSIARHQLFH